MTGSSATTSTLAQTPLHGWHAAHGGRMVDFAGWSMPVQYSSIVTEHVATRTNVGLFDTSHMGRLRLDGRDAAKLIDRIVTRRVTDLPPGKARYALITNYQGRIMDDVLVYHLRDAGGGSYYLLVVNAGNRIRIFNWIDGYLDPKLDARQTDISSLWAMIAVQGPKAMGLVAQLAPSLDVGALKYYSAQEAQLQLGPGRELGAVVSRTGYTGEDGCELFVGSGAAVAVWEWLVARGAVAAGLGARDTLRLEAGMPLYGHELSEKIEPYEAGLGFAVDLEGRSFPGCEVLAYLVHATPARRRVGLEMDGKRVPREGYAVSAAGEKVGAVTSGTFSPTFSRPLAMAYVRENASAIGTPLEVDIRGQAEPARVVKLPFYRRPAPGSNA